MWIRGRACGQREDTVLWPLCATTARDAHTAVRDRCSAARAMHSSVCWLSAARTGQQEGSGRACRAVELTAKGGGRPRTGQKSALRGARPRRADRCRDTKSGVAVRMGRGEGVGRSPGTARRAVVSHARREGVCARAKVRLTMLSTSSSELSPSSHDSSRSFVAARVLGREQPQVWCTRGWPGL